jgi:membrane protease YdiL (CAAX protease family)
MAYAAKEPGVQKPGVRPSTFFALTFALSWAIWIPLNLSQSKLVPWHLSEGLIAIVRLVGVLMPATAALLLAVRARGRAGASELLGRLAIWRVGWQWWLAAALVQPGLAAVLGLLYNALGGQPPIAPAAPLSLAALAVQAFFLLIATLGEEIGWRGVALPALQQRYGPAAASLVLGLVWATWHLPFWILLGTLQTRGAGYLALNYLLIVPTSVYITWFYNHGRGSLLLPVAYHLGFNLVNVLWLPVTSNASAFAWLIAAEWVLALLLLPRLAPRRQPLPVWRGA